MASVERPRLPVCLTPATAGSCSLSTLAPWTRRAISLPATHRIDLHRQVKCQPCSRSTMLSGWRGRALQPGQELVIVLSFLVTCPLLSWEGFPWMIISLFLVTPPSSASGRTPKRLSSTGRCRWAMVEPQSSSEP